MLETFKAFARQMHVFAGERACPGRLGTKTGAASSPRTKPLGSGRPEPAGRSLGRPLGPAGLQEELQEVFTRLGCKVSASELGKVLKDADADKDACLLAEPGFGTRDVGLCWG